MAKFQFCVVGHRLGLFGHGLVGTGGGLVLMGGSVYTGVYPYHPPPFPPEAELASLLLWDAVDEVPTSGGMRLPLIR